MEKRGRESKRKQKPREGEMKQKRRGIKGKKEGKWKEGKDAEEVRNLQSIGHKGLHGREDVEITQTLWLYNRVENCDIRHLTSKTRTTVKLNEESKSAREDAMQEGETADQIWRRRQELMGTYHVNPPKIYLPPSL